MNLNVSNVQRMSNLESLSALQKKSVDVANVIKENVNASKISDDALKNLSLMSSSLSGEYLAKQNKGMVNDLNAKSICEIGKHQNNKDFLSEFEKLKSPPTGNERIGRWDPDSLSTSSLIKENEEKLKKLKEAAADSSKYYYLDRYYGMDNPRSLNYRNLEK